MSEPDREYDLYCERKEREYSALIEGKACLDCAMCVKPDLSRHNGYGGIGYCLEVEEFVFEEDTPETQACYRFEP